VLGGSISGEIVVREQWRGSRGGTYYYVREGDVLRHIGSYAISARKVDESRKGPTLEYVIPAEELAGKEVYEFSFSNSGYMLVYKYPPEALLNPDPSYPYRPNFNLRREVSPDELRRLRFEVRDLQLRLLLEEFNRYWRVIIDDLKDYTARMNVGISFFGHAEATASIYEDPSLGLVRCLALQDDGARMRCLERPMAWLYQLWVMKLACEALGISKFKSAYGGEARWIIEQGKPYPAFQAEGKGGEFTFWFEPQVHEMAHMARLLTGRKEHVRPDIAVARGRYDKIDDLLESGRSFDLIIECKHTEFDRWSGDVDTQIPAYVENFKPKALVVASLKPVPNHVKRKLGGIGVVVVDELTPYNTSAIEEFKGIVRKALAD